MAETDVLGAVNPGPGLLTERKISTAYRERKAETRCWASTRAKKQVSVLSPRTEAASKTRRLTKGGRNENMPRAPLGATQASESEPGERRFPILSALVYSCLEDTVKRTDTQMHLEPGRCQSTWVPAGPDFGRGRRQPSTPRGAGSAQVRRTCQRGAGLLRILRHGQLWAWASKHPSVCPCQLRLVLQSRRGAGAGGGLPPCCPPRSCTHTGVPPPRPPSSSLVSSVPPTLQVSSPERPFHPGLG